MKMTLGAMDNFDKDPDYADAMYLWNKIRATSDLEWEKLTAMANEGYCGKGQTTYAVIFDEPQDYIHHLPSNLAFYMEEPEDDQTQSSQAVSGSIPLVVNEKNVPILYGSLDACNRHHGLVVTAERLISLIEKLEQAGAYGW